jgi:hypothetical protein
VPSLCHAQLLYNGSYLSLVPMDKGNRIVYHFVLIVILSSLLLRTEIACLRGVLPLKGVAFGI